ncbi:hypothetical protein ACFE04_027466 [Oxalis oulophora]
MVSTSESEVNSYDASPSLRKIFNHDYDNYLPLRMCRCGVVADLMTSKTKGNPGRRFYTCSNRRCNYFLWHDGVFPHRCVELINKMRDQLGSLEYYDCFINQERRLDMSNHRFLKMSIAMNVILLLVIAFMFGKM